MPANPQVSVIVTAFNRHQYLESAVRSVLNQTLSRSLYEIIVVKNFRHPRTDNFLETAGVKSISSSSVSEGAFLLEGLREARGRIICFLDDDDEFSPDKLHTVCAAFESDPSLVFYHNGQLPIDFEGRAIGEKVGLRDTRTMIIRFRTPLTLMQMKALTSHKIDFNMSSISVCRETIANNEGYMRSLRAGRETFVLACSLTERGCNIAGDSRKLTRYRVHSMSYSQVSLGTVSETTSLTKKYSSGLAILAGLELVGRMGSVLDDPAAKNYVYQKITSTKLLLDGLAGVSGRIHMLAALYDYLRYAYQSPDRRIIPRIAYIFGYLISKRIARRLYLEDNKRAIYRLVSF